MIVSDNLALLIDNIKMTTQFLDFIEESRHLTVQEWNFRDILLQKLQAPWNIINSKGNIEDKSNGQLVVMQD